MTQHINKLLQQIKEKAEYYINYYDLFYNEILPDYIVKNDSFILELVLNDTSTPGDKFIISIDLSNQTTSAYYKTKGNHRPLPLSYPEIRFIKDMIDWWYN